MFPPSFAFEAPPLFAESGDEGDPSLAQKLYELINTGELESYTEGKSRRITVSQSTIHRAPTGSRMFGAAALHPTEMINHVRREIPVGDPAGRVGDQGNIPASSDLSHWR